MSYEQFIVFIGLPLLGYLLGSIPFAWVIGKMHGVDIRTVGSKNIGATNLGRTLGKKYFWQAFLLDAAKGFLPVLAVTILTHHFNAHHSTPKQVFVSLQVISTGPAPLRTVPPPLIPLWVPLITGTTCVLGHLFPIWLKFKGGKGVATGFGVVLGFWPLYTISGILAGLFFVFMLMVYRYISLASITAALVFAGLVAALGSWSAYPPLYVEVYDRIPLIVVACLFAAMIMIRHRANIRRLLNGTEPKVGQKQIEKAQFSGDRAAKP